MQKRLDHPDHFRHNQPASVAALRSLIGIRRNADRLSSGTLIDLTRIRKWAQVGYAQAAAAATLSCQHTGMRCELEMIV